MAKNKVKASEEEVKNAEVSQEELNQLLVKNARVLLAMKELEQKGLLVVQFDKNSDSQSNKDYQLLQKVVVNSQGLVLANVHNESDSHRTVTLMLPVRNGYPFVFNFDQFKD